MDYYILTLFPEMVIQGLNAMAEATASGISNIISPSIDAPASMLSVAKSLS